MEIIVTDFETYYDKDYSLSKLTTEEYINDPRFEVIMLGLRFPDGAKEVVTGTHDEIQFRLDGIDFSKYAVAAHNTMFDGAILSWVFGVKPLAWLDTLAMSRAMFGGRSNSLAALAKRYNLEDKLDTVHNMMGRRRMSLNKEEFDKYAVYCLHDVDLCHDLFQLMNAGWYDLESIDKRHPFPTNELRLIDALIRMYTEPALVLNEVKLQEHLQEVVARKEAILSSSGVDKDTLMSNPKFAELLESYGVVAPRKISATTGKSTYAFAKTDPGLKDLLEHSDERVQAVVAARLGVKSTLEETRTQRFIGISHRSKFFPVPLKYGAARTHRLGGMDKINLQNLPARGAAGGKLKRCIEAPPGYVIIDCDSSNIEARGLAWLAEQHDLVADFAAGVDVYCKMATRIYNRSVTKADTLERFCGKTVVLGCGYQTGKNKLQITLKAADPPVDLPIEECDRIIRTYRNTYSKIPDLWKLGDDALHAMHDNQSMWLGKEGALLVEGKKGIKLPSGLYISYPSLHQYVDEGRTKWRYKDVKGFVDIYGGKLIENVVQALARIIVTQQLLKIARQYKTVLTVHDAVACIARVEDASKAVAFVEECMRWVPKWATGWPLNCESGMGKTYGDC
jgi:DNA polymerase